MKNIKRFSVILLTTLLFYGCSKEELPEENINNDNTNESGHTPIYFFQSSNLKSLNLDDKGGAFFATESNNELTGEIYSIAYDPSDETFFGTTHYSSLSSNVPTSFESFNPKTKERIKKVICDDCDYHSVSVNTKSNKKILIKYGQSYEHLIFQEISSQGEIIFESPEISLGGQVSNFIYIPKSNSFVSKNDTYFDLRISVIDASTYELKTLILDVEYPDDPIGSSFNYNHLNYDNKNDIIYYLRSNGLYVIDLDSETAELIETNWIAFFQSKFGKDEELSLVSTIFYPPTNELIIQGHGFFGSSTGSNKFFAIDLTSNQAREINTISHTLYRVYGFAVKN